VATPREAEATWHRNARATRQRARGIVAAHRLGIAVPSARLQQAVASLSSHHGAAEPSMTKGWDRQMDQKVEALRQHITALASTRTKGKGKGGGSGSGTITASGGAKSKGKGKGQWGWQIDCSRCGSFEHAATSCPKLSAQCANCGKTGHTSIKCRSPDVAKVTCACCGEPGHKKVECPKSDYDCKKCGKQGHLQSVCWHKDGHKTQDAKVEPTKKKAVVEDDAQTSILTASWQCTDLGCGAYNKDEDASNAELATK
jgi:hypothetical protein